MFEKNVNQRLVIIGLAILVACIFLLKIDTETDAQGHKHFKGITTRLRPGLDVAGGVQMIFEINDTGQNNPNLAEDVKRLLQKRVDPRGVLDLEWRAVGRNRLEVEMPLPPASAKKFQEDYVTAHDKLRASTLTRGQVEAAVSGAAGQWEHVAPLQTAYETARDGIGFDPNDYSILGVLGLPPDARAPKLQEICGGLPARTAAWDAAQTARDARVAAQLAYDAARSRPASAPSATSAPTTSSAPASQPSVEAAMAALKLAQQEQDAALAAVRAAGLPPTREAVEAAVRLPADKRTEELKKLAGGAATIESLLLDAAAKYDAYTAEREKVVAAAGLDKLPMASRPLIDGLLHAAEVQYARDMAKSLRDAVAKGIDPNTPPPPLVQQQLQQFTASWRRSAEQYLDALDAVQQGIFPLRRFEELLDQPVTTKKRGEAIEKLCADFPTLASQLKDVVAKHDDWQSHRGYLDGPADLQRLLRGAGILSFRILATPDADNRARFERLRANLAERGPAATESRGEQGERWFHIDNPLGFFNVATPAELAARDVENDPLHVIGKHGDDWYVLALTGSLKLEIQGDKPPRWQLLQAGRSRDNLGRPNVTFSFDAVGAVLFGDLTGSNIGRQLGVFLDNDCYSSAQIKSQITTNGEITGDFSDEKVNYLVQSLNAGALPARLKDTPISERTLGSSLGQANLEKAVRAGLYATGAVIAIMLLYYMLAGMIANAATCLHVLLTLGAMSFLGARINLPGIAGIILGIGMSVDANVLIFERMREEKDRGASLRMMIKNGYDKALAVIIDTNLTTLLTCVIIYYAGSAEIRGFGLTLGWGIVTSLFTQLFVTRTAFGLLLKYNLIKDVKMARLIGVPKIDWYGKRWFFIPISLAIMVIGMGILIFGRGKEALSVEFLGGASAEIELVSNQFDTPGPDGQRAANDITLLARIQKVADSVAADGARLTEAQVEPVPGEVGRVKVTLPRVAATRLAALIAEPLESAKLLSRGAVDSTTGPNTVTLSLGGDATAPQVADVVHGAAAAAARLAGERLSRSSIAEVLETEAGTKKGLLYDLTTTETNKLLVQDVLEEALGSNLKRQPRITYHLANSYPITAPVLSKVVPNLPAAAGGTDVTRFSDGVAFEFTDLQPPAAEEALTERLRNMRLQPDFQNQPWRDFKVVGGTPTGQQDSEGHATYRNFVLLVSDPDITYSATSQDNWTAMRDQERKLAETALATEQSLRKVSQFSPQIASQSQGQAILALILSWLMIAGYMWFRFGQVRYGLAGVVALIHDAFIGLAALGIAGWFGAHYHTAAGWFKIEDFHIDMTTVAAILTIIGYSVNDTIVIFDRIRELRGRMKVVTPEVINRSINECMSRTLLTTSTVFVVLLVMYIAGGSSIRGFNFCMLVGTITGAYSTVVIASPLLLVFVGHKGEARGTGRGASSPTALTSGAVA